MMPSRWLLAARSIWSFGPVGVRLIGGKAMMIWRRNCWMLAALAQWRLGALDLFASCLCAARGGFPRPQPCGSLDVSEDELRLLRLFRPVNMEGSTMPSNCCKEWWGLNMAPNFCWQHRPWPKP
jgi:hypothetical protein